MTSNGNKTYFLPQATATVSTSTTTTTPASGSAAVSSSGINNAGKGNWFGNLFNYCLTFIIQSTLGLFWYSWVWPFSFLFGGWNFINDSWKFWGLFLDPPAVQSNYVAFPTK
jgi:hypothetical protein